MATGSLDANGIWIYGEDDSETTFSGLLNKLGDSVSDKFTGGLPIASGGTGATTVAAAQDNLKIGLVNVVPSSVTPVGAGSSASYDSTSGLITFATCTGLNINGVFTSAFKNYRMIITAPVFSTTGGILFRYRNAGTDHTTGYGTAAFYMRYNNNTVGNSGTGNPSIFLGSAIASTNSINYVQADITGPQTALNKVMTYINNAAESTGPYSSFGGGFVNVSNTFDGCTIYTGSGTFGGTVQFFGYRD